MASGTLPFEVSTRWTSQVRFCVLACPSGGFDTASSYTPSVTVQSGDGRFVMMTSAARSAGADALEPQAASATLSPPARTRATQRTTDRFMLPPASKDGIGATCNARRL